MAIEFTNPRIGVVFFSFLLDESLAEERQQFTLGKLVSTRLDVACAVTVRSVEQVQGAIAQVNSAGVDLVILVFWDWVREDLPISVARNLRAPVLLWGIVGESEYLPLAGVTCAASNLMRIGVPFRYVVGSIENPNSLAEIGSWARAAGAVGLLKRLRVGAVGLACPGLISTEASGITVARLGPQLVVLDPLRLIAEYERADEESISEATQRFVDPAFHFDGATQEDLEKGLRLWAAAKEIVSQEELDVIGIRCWPELRRYHGLSPCVAFSKLMDAGVMGSCENDPLAGVGMALGYWLTQHPVFVADINTVIEDAGLLRLWHCGAASLGLRGSERVQLRKTFHDNSGCTLDFPLKSGPVTLFKISRPCEGETSMLVACGEVTEQRGEAPRGNGADVRLSVPVAHFVNALVGGGFGHHLVVAYGEIAEDLAKLSELLGLTLVRV
jgi:L-fucose isomerase-like protein